MTGTANTCIIRECRTITDKRTGPLYDAARMLRKASRELEAAALRDSLVTYDTAELAKVDVKEYCKEAVTLIDAVLARITPYTW